jgi:hypothetical protein
VANHASTLTPACFMKLCQQSKTSQSQSWHVSWGLADQLSFSTYTRMVLGISFCSSQMQTWIFWSSSTVIQSLSLVCDISLGFSAAMVYVFRSNESGFQCTALMGWGIKCASVQQSSVVSTMSPALMHCGMLTGTTN